MKFFSTQGQEYNVDIRPSRWPRRTEDDCKSKIQWNVSCILNELHAADVILEEFYIPGDRLYLDFFIPRQRLAVEVNGRQHYEYSKFFHEGRAAFRKSRERDIRKQAWCAMNNIDLCVISYKDDEETIREKLKMV